MKLNFHSDAGHGWLECPRELLIQLGIKDKISQYSYQSPVGPNRKVYLEEDCDASVLIDALKKQNETVEFNEINYNDKCFIRDLPRING